MKNEDLISEVFKVLSNQMRLKIIKKLKEKNLCQCELASILNENPVNISRALSSFENLGILETKKKGKKIFPKIKFKRIFKLIEIAEDISKEIASFKVKKLQNFIK